MNRQDRQAVGSDGFERFLGKTSRRLLASTPEGFPALIEDVLREVTERLATDRASLQRILLPPEDPHYGEKGEYSNCVHYYPDDMEKYNACINHPGTVLQGEITEANLKAGTLRRLMYNPNFAALKASMKRFMDNSLP